ncbi:hypothetical protein [Streptomyces hawaiiensis]|uniref:hypothetical protein n=1 Tax=Streptomyces hawaiiensis TaxID=67305 RepID=UPI00364D586A
MNSRPGQGVVYPIHSLARSTHEERFTDMAIQFVTPTEDGVHVAYPDQLLGDTACASSDLVQALRLRGRATGVAEYFTGNASVSLENCPDEVDSFTARSLVLPCSKRWREAVTTALLGNWSDPLFNDGRLSHTAVGALKAEARAVHRQLVPVWRRGTRRGSVLSLDAGLGDGLSLYDLVAADADLLAHATGCVFEDARLNAVLRGLNEIERRVVFAYAEGEGTTWAEAAATVGSTDPHALGERVRRKAKRLAAEQRRRVEQRRA